VIALKTRWIWVSILFLGMIRFSAFRVYGEVIDGPTLAQKVYDRDVGKDSQAEVEMLLIDKTGKKSFRTFSMFVKDYGETSKSYTRFNSPASIEGTAFLSWGNKGADDDQFLYLPALQRVRRIVSSQKTSRFVNTDYTYEDMQAREVDEDSHRLVKEEKYEKDDCWVLESIPKDLENTQYGKRISWIMKDSYLPLKTEYYDKNDKLLKIFTARELKQVDGIWTITESEMQDFEREHRTLLRTNDISYNKGVPDRVFTTGYMEHKE
jgi:hypothetical protein